jgi:hypothetical protein
LNAAPGATLQQALITDAARAKGQIRADAKFTAPTPASVVGQWQQY